MSDVSLLSPCGAWVVQRDMGKKARQGLESLVAKIVYAAAKQTFGRGVMEEVYLAGFYHGATLMEKKLSPPSNPDGDVRR